MGCHGFATICSNEYDGVSGQSVCNVQVQSTTVYRY
jgi:hypothetical protein